MQLRPKKEGTIRGFKGVKIISDRRIRIVDRIHETELNRDT